MMRTFRRAKAQWDHTGETRTTKWKDTRRALYLGSFSLAVTFAGFGASLLDTRSDQQQSDYQRCVDRAKSGGEIKLALTAGSSHAAKTAGMFELMDELLARSGSESPEEAEFGDAVAEYSLSVDEYKAFVVNYDIVVLADCAR